MFRRLLHLIFGNLLFKIVSIVLALAVWGLAVLIRTHKVTTTISIELINIPSDVVITKLEPNKTTVTLQGKGTDFVKFLIHPPKYQLNLAMIKPGVNRIKLSADELVLSAPVLLKAIDPEYAEIFTDQLESKKVAVVIPYRIEPIKGVYITDVVIQDTVTLFGPVRDMEFLDEVFTDSLFISDYSAPQVSRKLKVVVPDSNFYKANPESITVIASIEKEETKTYSGIRVNISVTLPKRATVKPDTAIVTLRGPVSRMQTLEDSLIKVVINGSKLESGEYEMPAEISLPKGIFLVRCEPQKFEIKIR
jgi:YbbR domain-containing protein